MKKQYTKKKQKFSKQVSKILKDMAKELEKAMKEFSETDFTKDVKTDFNPLGDFKLDLGKVNL